ncbi:hypothetical protein [Parvularcula sp. LCG005]|uniref:hypothetical protein n=1 Tax=Parvularcula sp. LCG005 TaxID=3078805 RepID=UPI00294339D1|nr:hypothetical protein [Parvularcula sp. LCG005]WOI54301.1 hypothetical protein RUI03_04695 [Parvularcula sp. LCG005]
MSTALAVAASVVSAVGSFSQGVSNKRFADRQSARLLSDAAESRKLGALDAELIAQDSRREQGAAIAAAGGSGFAVDGTVNDALGSIATSFALDGQRARYEAGRRAAALKTEAWETRIRGRQSLLKGTLDGTGSLLSAGAQIAAAGQRGGA